MSDGGLRTASDETSFQCSYISLTFEAHVNLLVLTMIICLDVIIVKSIEGIVFGLWQIFWTRQVTALIKVSFSFCLVYWKNSQGHFRYFWLATISYFLVDSAPTCKQCLALYGRSWCIAADVTDELRFRMSDKYCFLQDVSPDNSCRL